MEQTPFIYGKIATQKDFTGRIEEGNKLMQNFNSLVNTIIISPRRWGKTSLVNKVSAEIMSKNKDIKVCQIDIFNIRTESDFYLTLAQEVLKGTSNKWEELAENAKQFLSKLLPKISFSPDSQSEISFGIELKDLTQHPDDILDLAERIAIAKGVKIVLCIDEFQSVSDFENPIAFQKKLRSHWQKHQHVCYCLYGSKRHMLMDVFTNTSMPFYKFGDILFLEKIDTQTWVEFIAKRFKQTDKHIVPKDAQLIAELVENHPYYVQQLAQQAWFRTTEKCNESIIRDAHESISNQLSLLFASMIESLTNTHVNFLKALLMGEKELSSKTCLEKYKLGTSANVIKIKESLTTKEIIDNNSQGIDIQDPYFKYWLKHNYFKIVYVNYE